MAGVLYALVALGFVLIYKASGIFNYAQGVMALFAAMTLVGVMEGQVPFAHLINAVLGTKVHHFGWHLPAFVGIITTVIVMVILAWLVQRIIFKASGWTRAYNFVYGNYWLGLFYGRLGRYDVGLRNKKVRCWIAPGN